MTLQEAMKSGEWYRLPYFRLYGFYREGKFKRIGTTGQVETIREYLTEEDILSDEWEIEKNPISKMWDKYTFDHIEKELILLKDKVKVMEEHLLLCNAAYQVRFNYGLQVGGKKDT